MWPTLRPGERRDDTTPGDKPGVLVDTGGRRYLFPGDRQVAMALAVMSLGADFITRATRVEFGTARGTSWVPEERIKVPTGVQPPDTAEAGWG